MAAITFDARKLTGPLNELVKVQIPETSRLALNEALFATQKRLKDEASRVFDRPVPFTLNSFKYDKGKLEGDQMIGRFYIRDEGPKGNAPSRYLNPTIRGGPTYRTRFSRRLTDHTIVTQIDGRLTQALERGKVLAPSGRSPKVRRNRYGNMSQGQYTQILSAIKGGKSSADLADVGAVPFSLRNGYAYIDDTALRHPFFRNRFTYPSKPGIYKIEGDGDSIRLNRVLTQINTPQGKKNFKFFEISEQTITKEFVQRFQRRILR